MRKLLIAIAAFATFAAGAVQAHVIPVASGMTELVGSARNFTGTSATWTSTTNLGTTQYSDVTLTIWAKGDYDNQPASANEFLDVTIDGILFAHWNASTSPSVAKDGTLYGTISLSASDWAKIAADNSMVVTWKNTAGVKGVSGDYVSYSVQGKVVTAQPGTAVPEPATLALFGLGLAGLGAMRRRKA